MAQAQATILQEINGLYVAVYGRAADGPGITYWCGTLGVSVAAAALTQVTLPQQIALGQAFVNTQSTYFLTLYPTTMNDITFVQQLYTNIGGNTGDAGGGSGRGGLLAFLILVGMILWILRACAR